ncbi:chondroitinase-B domain-containing protein [Shivajiella indica]|uniref:Chondroitinase-B domain-containing protein n=1 Tax=Shivajiella indica TaxID=872115 RepID=A0ABW5BF59_9BACT
MKILREISVTIFILIFFSCTTLTGVLNAAIGPNKIPFHELETYLSKNPSIDTVFIKNGEYKDTEIKIYGVNRDLKILPESIGGVKISGKSTLTFVNSSKISFSGFEFYGIANRSAIIIDHSNEIRIFNNLFDRCGAFQFGKIVRITNGASYNKIYNNTFDYLKSMGVVVDVSSSDDVKLLSKQNEIFNNVFINIPNVKAVYPNSDGNGLEAIQLGQGSPKAMEKEIQTKVYNNLFINIIGDRSEIISVKSSANFIFENVFLDNDSGITFRVGNNNVFSSNIVYNTRSGLRVFGKGHLIDKNYFEGGSSGIIIPAANKSNENANTLEGSFYFQPEDIRVERNLIINPESSGINIGSKFSNSRKFYPKNLIIEENILLTSEKSSPIVSAGNEDISIYEKKNRNLRTELDKSNFNTEMDSINNVIRAARKFELKNSKLGIDWTKN